MESTCASKAECLGAKSQGPLNPGAIFASKKGKALTLNLESHFQSLKEATDNQLVLLFMQENRREIAFTEIMNRYGRKVYFHVRNMLPSHEDADDAAQNTFVKVWGNLEKFKGDSQLYSWIYRIATNEALTILRKQKRNVSLEDVLPETLVSSQGSSETPESISLKLREAMSALPLKQKMVFYMKYFEELSYEQISEITETSVGALKASFFHAVKKIEQYLERTI